MVSAFDRTAAQYILESNDTTNIDQTTVFLCFIILFDSNTMPRKSGWTQTLNDVGVSSHFPKMHGSNTHIVSAQNLIW